MADLSLCIRGFGAAYLTDGGGHLGMESSCNRYGNVGAVRALQGWVLALVVAQGRNGCPIAVVVPISY